MGGRGGATARNHGQKERASGGLDAASAGAYGVSVSAALQPATARGRAEEKTMRMGTPGVEQGQMVERSYGWRDGALYMRVHDRSDRSTQWYVADEDSANALPEGYDAGGESHPPEVAEWTPCSEPRD